MGMVLTRSGRVCLAVAASAILVGSLTSVGAETARRSRKSQPVPTSRAAPDTTGTIATGTIATDKAAPARPAAAADDEALPTPFSLPAAPRARMRACGEKWQAIKLAGQAADQTWREYATKCLVSDDGPSAVGASPAKSDNIAAAGAEARGKPASP